MKKALALTLLTIFLTINGCNSDDKSSKGYAPTEKQNQANLAVSEEKLQVVASFYPAYEIAKTVGGEKINIINLTKPGVEPHDYDPSPQDIIKLQNASLVVVNGAGLEPWLEKMRQTFNQNKVKVFDQSAVIRDSLLSIDNQEEVHEEEHGKNSEEYFEGHEHGNFDPHFWLDPLYYIAQISALAQQLSELDPDNSSYYRDNSEKYQEEILKLHQEYENGLKNCKQKSIITNHQAFNYLAKRYGFEVISISGISVESEPSAKKLAELSRLVKEKNIKYIFAETLASPKIADTLAKEVGVKTMVLNPIENLTSEEIEKGENYITVMRSNLRNLQLALECNL